MPEHARVLRRRWRIVAVGALLGMAVAMVLAIVIPTRYSSEATLYLAAPGAPRDAASAYDGSQVALQRASFYVPLLDGPAFVGEVAQRSGLPLDAVGGSVTTVAEPETPVLRITAVGATPAATERLTGAALDVALDLVAQVEAAQSPEPQVFARVAQPPSPVEPDAVGVPIFLMIGLILGTAAGYLAALGRDILDRSVRDETELAHFVGRPVLGSIAHDPDFHKRPLSIDLGLQSDRAEAFRQLRTSLGFLPGRRRRLVAAIVSPMPAEGRTSVACNLAIALGQAGCSVVVVGSDLRAPRIEEYLGLTESAAGLTSVLVPPRDPRQVIRHWSRGPFDVLGSGPAVSNPSELLGSAQMSSALDRLRSRYDVVLLDTPPIGSVTDAVVVGALCDGVVFVTGRGRSTSTEVERAVGVLRRAGVPVLGSVLTMARKSRTSLLAVPVSPAAGPSLRPLPPLPTPVRPAGPARVPVPPQAVSVVPMTVQQGPDVRPSDDEAARSGEPIETDAGSRSGEGDERVVVPADVVNSSSQASECNEPR